MALEDLLSVKLERKKEIDIPKDRLVNNLEKYRSLIAYWRMYPDRMIDYLVSIDPTCHFKFYWYQRLLLRAMLRYKMSYMTFCRAYSKTFTGTLALICKAILYPGIKLFTVAPGKERKDCSVL